MENKIAVCVIVRNENRYIREWVEYYKSIGFDNILMIDNNDIGGECLADVIGDYINDGFVKMYYRRGDEQEYFQAKNYQKVYDIEKDNYEWIAFFDADEFLDMSHFGNDIHNFISQYYVAQSSKVHFKWQLYGDNEQIYYEDKPVQERFPEPLPKDERYIPETLYHSSLNCTKSMVHCKVVESCDFITLPTCSIHNPKVTSNLPCISPNGWILNKYVNQLQCFVLSDEIPFDLAYLKHYVCKSLEEFFYRKCINVKKTHTFTNGYKDFIVYNKDTPEKRLYYNILKNNNK